MSRVRFCFYAHVMISGAHIAWLWSQGNHTVSFTRRQSPMAPPPARCAGRAARCRSTCRGSSPRRRRRSGSAAPHGVILATQQRGSTHRWCGGALSRGRARGGGATQKIQTMQSHTPVFGHASGSWWQPSLACAAPRALAARASLPLHGSPAGEGRSPHARSIRSARGRMRRTWPHHDRLLESVSEIQNLLQQLDSLPDSTFLSTARGSRGSSQTATRTSLPDSWSSISTSASETSLLTGIFACGHHAHLRLPSQP